jgi:hypothetical protein
VWTKLQVVLSLLRERVRGIALHTPGHTRRSAVNPANETGSGKRTERIHQGVVVPYKSRRFYPVHTGVHAHWQRTSMGSQHFLPEHPFTA